MGEGVDARKIGKNPENQKRVKTELKIWKKKKTENE